MEFWQIINSAASESFIILFLVFIIIFAEAKEKGVLEYNEIKKGFIYALSLIVADFISHFLRH